MDEFESTSTPPRERKPFQNFRSTASNNWRMKDDSPRVESPQQQRGEREPQVGRVPRERNGDDSQGYSPRPRNGYGAQPRERNEIPTEVTTPRLYVGNLLYTAQTADVESFFMTSGFGITNVSMTIDPESGRNPSYCFVDLESVDEAKRALEELNGKELMGRSVRINPGVGRSNRDGPRDGSRVQSFQGGRGGLREGNANVQGRFDPTTQHRSSMTDRNDPAGETRSASDRYNRNDTSYQGSKPQEQGKRLYLGGLPQIEPQEAVEAEMQTLIANLNSGVQITTVSKLIAPHPSKATEPGDHYYLFLDVATTEDVDKVIEALDGQTSPWSENGQGKLKVNRARENPGRKVGGREQGDRPSYREGQRDIREGQERSFGKPSWRDSPAQ